MNDNRNFDDDAHNGGTTKAIMQPPRVPPPRATNSNPSESTAWPPTRPTRNP